MPEHVLVEGEVRHPGARTLQAAALHVAKLAISRNRIRSRVEELIPRAAGGRIADQIGPPGLTETADTVERPPGIPRAGRIEPAEERGQIRPAACLNDR